MLSTAILSPQSFFLFLFPNFAMNGEQATNRFFPALILLNEQNRNKGHRKEERSNYRQVFFF